MELRGRSFATASVYRMGTRENYEGEGKRGNRKDREAEGTAKKNDGRGVY